MLKKDYLQVADALRTESESWCRTCINLADRPSCTAECDVRAFRDAADFIEAVVNGFVPEIEDGGRWISTKDHFPGNGDRVLTAGPKGGIQICKHETDETGRKHYFVNHKRIPAKVDYWMPLPAPPCRDDKGGEQP